MASPFLSRVPLSNTTSNFTSIPSPSLSPLPSLTFLPRPFPSNTHGGESWLFDRRSGRSSCQLSVPPWPRARSFPGSNPKAISSPKARASSSSSPIRPTWTTRPFTAESSLHGSLPLVLFLRTAGFLKFLFIFAKWIS